MTQTSVTDTGYTFSARSPRRFLARGFTLLELLVVMAVIVIAIGILLPNLATTDNSTFNAQVRRAVAVLNHARRVAIVEGAPRSAHFHVLDPERGDYDERRAAIDSLAAGPDVHWVSEVLRVAYRGDAQEPFESQEELSITFYPQGGSTGGELELVLDDRKVHVRVDPMTGRIATDLQGGDLDDAR